MSNAPVRGNKKTGSVPNEDVNSLRSKSLARVQDLLGYGEWEGLVDGAKSIYLDSTPLVSPDGTENFTDIKWSFVNGTQDQKYMDGFDTQENYVSVGILVSKQFPVTRRIINSNCDQINVHIRIPALYRREENGDVLKAWLQFRISLSVNGEPFHEVKFVEMYEKCTTDYFETYPIRLPKSNTPDSDYWDIRVERILEDHIGSSTRADSFYFDGYSEVTSRKLRFPNMVIAGMEIDSQNLSSVPRRTFHVKMRKIRVPKNYDPVTRTYATTGPGTTNGGWDGTFKVAYSNNPAWIYYDISTDENIGIGQYIRLEDVDKWNLYEIGQYCDRMVPDGKGGTEPLMTLNFVINEQKDALKLLSTIATAFRAMIAVSAGRIIPIQDRPYEVITSVYTNANVKNGAFTYTSTGQRARKTVAEITFKDRDDFFSTKVHLVEDYEGIRRYGYNVIKLEGFGITSRSEAHRYGKYALRTELEENRAVSFRTGIEARMNRLGEAIYVYDRYFSVANNGGRVSYAAGTATSIAVPLDREVTIEAGKAYYLTVTYPDAITDVTDITDSTMLDLTRMPQMQRRQVINSPGVHTVLNVATAFPSAPENAAVWVLEATDLAPQKIRIISIKEITTSEYEISGNRIDNDKFDEVEKDPNFEEPPVVRFPKTGDVAAVINLKAELVTVTSAEGVEKFIEVGWTNADLYADKFQVSYSYDGGVYSQVPLLSSPTARISVIASGPYNIRVIALRSLLGQKSNPASIDFTVTDSSTITLFSVTGLELKNKGTATQFEGNDAKFVWRLNSPSLSRELSDDLPASEDGQLDPLFAYYLVRVYEANSTNILFEERTLNPYFDFSYEKNLESSSGADPYRTFTVKVYAVDKYQNRSLPAELTVSNPAPSLPECRVREGYASISLTFTKPTDTDYKGIMIWASTTSPVTIEASNLVYDGPDVSYVHISPAGETVYFKYAAYDAFGKTDLIYSPQFSATSNVSSDTTAPAIPTGLVLTSELRNASDGTQECILMFRWNVNTEDDFLSYLIRYKTSTSGPFDWVNVTVSGKSNNYVEVAALPNRNYDAQIAAVDDSSNFTEWSPVVTHLTLGDTVPPAAPTWIEASIRLNNVYLRWNGATENDFAYWELLSNTTNNLATASVVATKLKQPSELLALNLTGEQATATSRYYWLYAYDTSGNKSGASAPILATSSGLSAPTGLTVTSSVVELSGGMYAAQLNATVAASTHPDFDKFEWKVSRTDALLGDTGYYLTQGNTFKLSSVASFVTYYVQVRQLSKSGTYSPYSAAVSHTTAKDTTAPAMITGLSGKAGIGSVYLQWAASTEIDVAYYEVHRKVGSGSYPATAYAETDSNTWMDPNTETSTTYTYRITAVDYSGNKSAPSAEVSFVPGALGAASLEDFSVGLTKMYHATIALSADIWTHNSPVAGSIQWNAHTLYYKGAAYSISGGNTALRYIYWDSALPSLYQASNSYPALSDGQFMIATNVGGAYDLAWNALANAVIGTAYIADLAVTDQKVASMTVDKLLSGTITSKEIIISGGSSGILRSSGYLANTAGWIIRGDGSAEFNNVLVRGRLTSSTIDIGSSATTVFKVDADGNMWIGAANFADAPFKVSNTGVMTAASAVISGTTSVASSLQVGVTFVLGDAGTAASSILQSYNFVSGSSGFRLRGNGDAELNNVTLRGVAMITGSIAGTDLNTVKDGAALAASYIGSTGNFSGNVVGSVGGQSASTVSAAVTTVNTSFSGGKLISAVKPSAVAAPSGAGLYLGGDYMGYFNGSLWRSYMDNAGRFYLSSGDQYLAFDGTNLSIKGSLTLVNQLTPANISGLASTATNSDYGAVTGTKPPANADSTLATINGGLVITSGGLTLNGSPSIKSSTYVNGSAGWIIKGDGSAEFNDVVVRGQLISGKIATSSVFFNTAAPNKTFPSQGILRASYAYGFETASSQVESMVTAYGWNLNADGIRSDRIGKTNVVFSIAGSCQWTVPNGQSVTVSIIYRRNGGGWVDLFNRAYAARGAEWSVMINDSVEISGIGGNDTIDFGLRMALSSSTIECIYYSSSITVTWNNI